MRDSDQLGSASTTLVGGTGEVTYMWSNGTQEANLTNVEAGEYTVTVTDEAGCEKVHRRHSGSEPAIGRHGSVSWLRRNRCGWIQHDQRVRRDVDRGRVQPRGHVGGIHHRERGF